MKFYNWLLRYRLWLGIAMLVLAVVVNIYSGFWPAFVLYFVGVVLIFTHFFID